MVYLAVLASAMIHAVWNAMLKSSGDRVITLVAIRCVGLAFGLAVVPFVPLPAPAAWPYLLLAAAIHYVYFWFMIKAYEQGDFSQVYPIARGSAPLIVVVMTLLSATEPIPTKQLIAIGVMTSGLCLLASTKGASVRPVLYALATGASIAAYSYFSGVGIRLSGSRWAYVGWLEVLVSSGMVVWGGLLLRTRLFSYWQTNWRQGLTAGVLSVGGFLIALWAMSVATIAAVVAVRETSALFGALIGAWVFKEGFAVKRVVAAALVVAGIGVLVF
jgi:drug/metabolite transporter (DMT)-like permease